MANVLHTLTSSSSQFEVLPSAARTTAPDTHEFEITGRGYEYGGLHLVLDLTAFTTAASLTVTVSGVDRISGKTYPLIVSAAITSVSVTALEIGPGITASANLSVSKQMPPIFRVSVAHGNANSTTYSVSGVLV